MHGKKVMVLMLCALLLFEALALASVLLVGQKALADEATFYSTASDGNLERQEDPYSAAHNAANADSVEDGDTDLWFGQLLNLNPPYNFIGRGALFFDTSSLPDNVIITSATLSLYGSSDASSGSDFDITVVDGSLLNDPLVAGDYGDLLNQTTSGGAFNTAGFSYSYNDIQLNAAGMGWISKTGMTKFGLRSSREINAIVPSGYEYVYVYAYEEGDGYRPMLVVTYGYPTTSVPTLSQWGMIGMGILFSAALVWSVKRRCVVSTDKS